MCCTQEELDGYDATIEVLESEREVVAEELALIDLDLDQARDDRNECASNLCPEGFSGGESADPLTPAHEWRAQFQKHIAAMREMLWQKRLEIRRRQ